MPNFTDTIQYKVTPKVNRKKAKDIQIGDVVPMRQRGLPYEDSTWMVVTASATSTKYAMSGNPYEIVSGDDYYVVCAGNSFVQVHD